MNEESIFAQAIAQGDEGARRKFVKEACDQDPQLQLQVERLLQLHDNAGNFLEDHPLENALRMTLPYQGGTQVDVPADGRAWPHGFSPSTKPGVLGTVGQYEVLSLVARGGMGIVYKARQANLRRIVALKMIRDPALSTPEAIRRLQNEAEAAARLQHKNIVRIYEFGEAQGLHFYSMEFVEGRTLEEVAGGKPLPAEQAARYTETIATAIHYAHRRGVLHRDLKPANVMLDANDCVRITDFGLAKQMDVTGTMSETGQILGTAGYMSPEQASARQKTVGPASDVFSIGVILYELLTGVAPFQGETPWEILRRVCEQDPLPLRKVNASIPKDLESICLRCLQKDERQRYASAGELARDLRRFRSGQPVLARSIGPAQRISRWAARNRVVVTLSSTILLLACVVAGLMVQSPVVEKIPENTPTADQRNAAASAVVEATEPDTLPNPAIAAVAENAPLGGEIGGIDADAAVANAAKPPVAQPPLAVAPELPPRPVPPELDDPLYALRALRIAESPKATVEATAIAGEPFGVGQVTIQFDAQARVDLKPDQPVWLTEKSQRVLYPAVEQLRDEQKQLRGVTVRFLFQGTENLNLQATAIGSYTVQVTPDRTRSNATQLSAWWDAYSRPAHDMVGELAGHDMLRNYLKLMLARRLKLTLPDQSTALASPVPMLLDGNSDFARLAHELLGTSSIRVAMQKEVLLDVPERREKASFPLPPPLTLPSVTIPNFKPDLVEALAGHVPEECIYVRFQTLADWKWFRGTLSDWGGNLTTFVAQRGLDQGIQRRLERQLALNEETAAELFSNDAIAEFALVAGDTFYNEGAAFGMLFRANDSAALQASIERQRRSAARGTPQARLTTEKIAGRDVSFLGTADNSIRSFHAVDGDKHFVTTSRHLVERFFEAGAGEGSLAKLKAFQYARSKFPLVPNIPVFIYMSDPFFANFLSPQYRIEMTRRARALAALELVQMARWAAIAERRPYETTQDLIAAGLLPESVQFRAEGGELLLNNGVPSDSLRGAAGTFLPIPDMQVTGATNSEQVAYKRFNDQYLGVWKKMDPVTIALRHEQREKGGDRLVADVSITPLAQRAFAGSPLMWFPILRATNAGVKAPAGSILHLSAALSLEFFPKGKHPYYAIAGLNESPDAPVAVLKNGILELAHKPQDAIPGLSAYMGINNMQTLVKDLKGVLRPDGDPPEGEYVFDESPFTLTWTRFWDDWIAISPRRDTLEQLTPAPVIEPMERPAQIRFTLAQLQGTRWGELARMGLFVQARHLSAANPCLLHELMQQLHLESDEALPLAEELLRGRLVCPLGGRYVAVSAPGRPAQWVSTAWTTPSLSDINAVPASFETSFLHWFRGLAAETTVDADTLTIHFELNTNPEGAGIQETVAQTEATARKELAKVLEATTTDQRDTAFHAWVNRFQQTALVDNARTALPDLWLRREDNARVRLTALGERADSAELNRLADEHPRTQTAQTIRGWLRERAAEEDWARLAPTLPAEGKERRRLVEEFVAKYAGTETAKRMAADNLR